MLKNNVQLIENFNQIEPEKSQIINAGTVEGLLHYMKHLGPAISFFDESSQFLGSFGRYNGSGSANYERSIYLTLANAQNNFKRDLKQERTSIIKPRLNICLNGHPYYFIDALNGEKNSNDDGLFQRFFISCPKPSIFLSADILNSADPDISLVCVLYFIHRKYYSDNICLSLSEEAKLLFNHYYDTFKILARDGNFINCIYFVKIIPFKINKDPRLI